MENASARRSGGNHRGLLGHLPRQPAGLSLAPGFRGGQRGAAILFLGDSYTFGSGVEEGETFVAILERQLDDTAGYNLGIGGFGIDQMWMTMVHYGLPLEPDLVVLSFVRPDLDRSLTSYRRGHVWRRKPTFRLVGGELEPMTRDHRPPPLRRFVERHSRLYGMWRKAESSLSRRFPIGASWRLNRAIFAAIRDHCRKAKVSLVVVHIPVNRRHPVPMYARELSRTGIPYVDLTPLLPETADALYYPHDRHLNAAGHRFVAARILDLLETRDLLP